MKRGFTLIEVLVVVSVIGMLASIVLVSLKSAKDRADYGSGLVFEKNMQHAIGTNSVLYYDFEEGSGTVTQDKSFINYGNNPGNLTSAFLWNSETPPGSGSNYSFASAGSSKRMSASYSLGLSTSDFTIGTWIKTTSSGNGIYVVGNAVASSGYGFGISGGLTAFTIGNGPFTQSTCGSKVVNDNKWHYIVGEFDRSGLAFRCYVDGHIVGTVPIQSYPGISDAPPYMGTPPLGTEFTGLLDNVVIYNKNLQ